MGANIIRQILNDDSITRLCILRPYTNTLHIVDYRNNSIEIKHSHISSSKKENKKKICNNKYQLKTGPI